MGNNLSWVAAPFRTAADVASEAIAQAFSLRDYPDITVKRMHAQSRPQFLGILRLLEEDATTPAAEPLMRSLIEFYAQVAWIADGIAAPARSWFRQRALCYEVGMGRHLVNIASTSILRTIRDQLTPQTRAMAASMPELSAKRLVAAATAPDVEQRYEGATAGLAADLQAIRQLHRATLCRCKGRSRDIQPTLKAMARVDPIAPVMLALTSGVSHHAFEGVATAMGGTVSKEVGPQPITTFYIGYSSHLFFESVVRLLRASDCDVDPVVTAIGAAERTIDFGALLNTPGLLAFAECTTSPADGPERT